MVPGTSANQLRDELSSLRNNLKSGGKWFYKRKDYANAVKYFDMYLNTIGHSLISNVGKKNPSSIDAPCTRASLVAQMVKNLPAVQETWVQYLGWEDPLE